MALVRIRYPSSAKGGQAKGVHELEAIVQCLMQSDV